MSVLQLRERKSHQHYWALAAHMRSRQCRTEVQPRRLGKDRASRRGTWGHKSELPGTPTMPETLENVQSSSNRSTVYAGGRWKCMTREVHTVLALTSAASRAQPRLRYSSD